MKILRKPETKGSMGWRADESLYSRIRSGEFPSGVAIGERARGWPEHEVEAVVRATIAGYTPDQMKELVKQLHADRAKLAPPPIQAGKTPTPPTPLPTITTQRKSLAAA